MSVNNNSPSGTKPKKARKALKLTPLLAIAAVLIMATGAVVACLLLTSNVVSFSQPVANTEQSITLTGPGGNLAPVYVCQPTDYHLTAKTTSSLNDPMAHMVITGNNLSASNITSATFVTYGCHGAIPVNLTLVNGQLVGTVDVSHGGTNVIPANCSFTADLVVVYAEPGNYQVSVSMTGMSGSN